MTGRDLIIYILENNLEDSAVFEDGRLLGFMTVGEVAKKNDVGTATVLTWLNRTQTEALIINGTVYIPASFTLPTLPENK